MAADRHLRTDFRKDIIRYDYTVIAIKHFPFGDLCLQCMKNLLRCKMDMVEAPGAFAAARRNTACYISPPFVLAGVLLTAIPGRSELSSQALNRFLAGQIAPDVHEFGEIRMSRADIAQRLQKLRTAKKPRERGVAVANLQNCAGCFSYSADHSVALEILNQWA